VQSFTACVPLLTAASAFGLGRRCWLTQVGLYYDHKIGGCCCVIITGFVHVCGVLIDVKQRFEAGQYAAVQHWTH